MRASKGLSGYSLHANIRHFRDGFTNQMTQPTVSKRWRKLVDRKDQASVPPGPLHHVAMSKHQAAQCRVPMWRDLTLMQRYGARSLIQYCIVLLKPILTAVRWLAAQRIVRQTFAVGASLTWVTPITVQDSKMCFASYDIAPIRAKFCSHKFYIKRMR